MPGGSYASNAYGTTPDGAVVVGGSASAEGSQAYRWTAETGMIGLGDLSGGAFFSRAHAVSDDAAVVVGQSESTNGEEAFRWTASSGMVGLGDLPGGGLDSEARGVSADGSVVVGQGEHGVFPNRSGAFVWTEATGMLALPDLEGGDDDCWANAVTPDGQIVVGRGAVESGNRAVRWVGGVAEDLGLPPGVVSGQSVDVSVDGRAILIWAADGAGFVVFVRREGGEFVEVPPPSGVPSYFEPLGLSDDGAVVVGVYGAEGFWWTQAGGTRLLQDVLEDEYGLDLGGWLVTDPE